MTERLYINKVNYKLWCLWQLTLLLPFLFSDVSSLWILLKFVLYNNAAFLTGWILFSTFLFRMKIPELTVQGLALFFGHFIIALFLLTGTIPFSISVVVFTICFWILPDYKKTVIIRWESILYILTAIGISIILFNKSELLYHIGRTYPENLPDDVFTWMDPYFFTSVVATVRESSIYSSLYETGTPLSYHFLGYVPASAISQFTGVSSYFALYTLWIPFLSILLLILFTTIPKMFFQKEHVLYGVGATLLYLLLQPIHYKDILFNVPATGTGYMFINTNAGTDVALILIVFFIWIVLSKTDIQILSYWHKAIIVILLVCLALIKQPAFFVVGGWLGFLSLFEIIKKRFSLFIMLMITAALTVTANAILITSEYSARTIIFKPLFLFEYVSQYANYPIQTTIHYFVVLAAFLVLLLMWGNLRWIVLMLSFKNLDYKKEIIAYVLLFVCTILLINVIDIDIKIDIENVILDGSFDLIQFIKFNFFFLSVLSVIFSINLVIKAPAAIKYWKWVFVLFLIISFSGITYSMRSIRYTTYEDTWLQEIMQSAKRGSMYTFIVNPSNKFRYTGHLIASDIGKFWVSITPENGAYNFNLKNRYRWDLIHELLSTKNNDKKTILSEISGDTDHIIFIATPDDLNLYLLLTERDKIFVQDAQCKWLFYPKLN